VHALLGVVNNSKEDAMGRLTEEMTRLQHEISALRDARETFGRDLEAFAEHLKEGVSAMRADIRNAHAEMTESARLGRQAFASGLREGIAGLRQEIASDVAGARLAFAGGSHAERSARKPRPRAQRKGR
jgi:phosphoenolpyruvate-protein kinase (PTS system EI component)